jgi:hypothetical protein
MFSFFESKKAEVDINPNKNRIKQDWESLKGAL